MNSNRNDNHEQYTSTNRHFCPKSERYTGADSLIAAQRLGWVLVNDNVYREDILLRGSRFRTIYYFHLKRGEERLMMPIISTPAILQKIQAEGLHIVPHTRAHAIELEETIIFPARKRA